MRPCKGHPAPPLSMSVAGQPAPITQPGGSLQEPQKESGGHRDARQCAPPSLWIIASTLPGQLWGGWGVALRARLVGSAPLHSCSLNELEPLSKALSCSLSPCRPLCFTSSAHSPFFCAHLWVGTRRGQGLPGPQCGQKWARGGPGRA